MTVYEFNSNNELIQAYQEVIRWGNNFVEYKQNGNRIKIYASNGNYFSDSHNGNKDTYQEQIDRLQENQTDTELAITELASNMETYQTDNELALAELAELIGGANNG